VGYDNPPIPWRELEAKLSDRPARRRLPGAPPSGQPPGDGGDSPAWSYKRPAYQPPPDVARQRDAAGRVPYAELHCHSNFSFLDGASHPEELVEEAARLGLEALAITDHDGLYGVVRFAEAARALGVPSIFGAELSIGLTRSQNGVADPEGTHLVVLARDPTGYSRLCRAISAAHLAGGEKGRPLLELEELAAAGASAGAGGAGHWVVLTGCRKGAVPRALVD
jgi:error-prone DNA polymerase